MLGTWPVGQRDAGEQVDEGPGGVHFGLGSDSEVIETPRTHRGEPGDDAFGESLLGRGHGVQRQGSSVVAEKASSHARVARL